LPLRHAQGFGSPFEDDNRSCLSFLRKQESTPRWLSSGNRDLPAEILRQVI
jgi:hypothetical protein